jgi:hypothetical protein
MVDICNNDRDKRIPKQGSYGLKNNEQGTILNKLVSSCPRLKEVLFENSKRKVFFSF